MLGLSFFDIACRRIKFVAMKNIFTTINQTHLGLSVLYFLIHDKSEHHKNTTNKHFRHENILLA